jgi:pimeloyl-ACP methyl ester carboxylesterase
MDLAKVRETEAIEAEYAYLAGTVRSAASHAPDASHPDAADWIVVYVLTVPCDADWKTLKDRVERGGLRGNGASAGDGYEDVAERLRGRVQLADHVVLQRSGFWYVRVAPGCCGVGAFVDSNRNYRYDDEPLASAIAKADRLVELGPGDRREGIELVIDPDARMAEGFDSDIPQIRSAEYRSHKEQLLVSLGEVTAEGEVADLDDPRFGPESGRRGYFDVYRFLWQAHPGIYFLEPYDPDRIPVLFVHGASGFPQSFETLIANLDRQRFQPWVALYPSGSRLDSVADYLSRNVAHLQLRYGFEQMAVVAHSMGGLVSRAFILRHHATMVDDPVKVFVSISTPWSGVPSAASGIERSPYVVPSWRDVEPESRFIAELFFEDPERRSIHRRLPEEVAFYLIFGVQDQTVPISSEVRWEAVRDARERWPLTYDHTGILQSAEASKLLNEILERALP